jgi:predicted NAD/FAD-binding protein
MSTRRRVIVVGAGIAGLSSVFHLCKYGDVSVTLLESESELGGHSKTITHKGELVDLGFQVFNRETYPVLCELYRELLVEPVPSDMSFATELGGACIKYSADLRPFISWCEKRALFLVCSFDSPFRLLRSPREVYDFIVTKTSFHGHALSALAEPGKFAPTLAQFFASYSPVFYRGWIVPFASAVWSLRESEVGEFDVQTFLRFMRNHGFLSWSTLQWLTLPGGARQEVEAFERYFAKHGVEVHVGTRAIAWNPTSKELRAQDSNGTERVFSGDVLLLAVPAPIARAILGAHSPPELAPFQVSSSTVVMHDDASMMPRDRTTWASWNVVGGVSTYWLHSIQKCRVANQQLFVSVLSGDKVSAACAVKPLWSGAMSHPKLQHGTAPMQKRLLSGLFVGGSVAFAGAWLQYGFHEDGALTGAIAARNVLGDARIAILTPSHPLQHSASPVWIAERTTVTHASQQASRHTFAYPVQEMAVVDVASLPSYWWGGVMLEDHWNQNGAPLLHSIPLLVRARLGFYPDGKVHLITTMRAFGQAMNPISLYVCWGKNRRAPEAFVLEVHNYPWGELHCYVVDARSGVVEGNTFSLQDARFDKTLHVSPWHPHPEDAKQHYLGSFEISLAPGSSELPFERLQLRLRLHERKAAEEVMLFSSHWSVGELQLRFPKPLAIGLQTSFRILREAVTLSSSGRTMYTNVTNPHAPMGVQTVVLAMACFLLLARVLPWPSVVMTIAVVVFRSPAVPLLRDLWLGLVFALIARFLV